MLQPKKPQHVRHRQSTKAGMETESFHKEPPTQRQSAGGDTGVQTQSPKCQRRGDESMLILLSLFMVQSRRCGGWAAGRAAAGRSCDAVGAISRQGAWMAGAASSSLWQVDPLPPMILLEVDAPAWASRRPLVGCHAWASHHASAGRHARAPCCSPVCPQLRAGRRRLRERGQWLSWHEG